METPALTQELVRYELVRTRGQFPVDLYPFQQRAVEELAPLDRTALYLDVGCGKTLTSLAIAQYKIITGVCNTVLIIVPPVLMDNWSRTVAKIPGATHVMYRGTPAQRKNIDLSVRFIIVGIQIFKRDYAHIVKSMTGRLVFGIVDEAQMLKNPTTDNFKKVREFFSTEQLCLLTGTPMSTPPDAYALIKLVSPGVYRTFNQWSSIHVAEVDFFKKPTKYMNLDLLSKNLMLNAVRVIKEDVLQDLPELTYTPIHYDLNPDHLALYRRIADDQMVKLEEGGKLDLTNVSALWNALSQLPANAEHFSQGETDSTVYELVDAVLDELGGRKLIIFCQYRMTVKRLREKLASYNPAVLFGETKDRQAEIDKFVEDPSCLVFIANTSAGGAGIDTLQHVSSDLLFIELPHTAAMFHQATARAHRAGQRNAVNCRIAIANKTLQNRAWDIVMERDSLINSIIRGPQDIRAALAGD